MNMPMITITIGNAANMRGEVQPTLGAYEIVSKNNTKPSVDNDAPIQSKVWFWLFWPSDLLSRIIEAARNLLDIKFRLRGE